MVRITPIYKPWSSAIWKGSHNPILRGLTITMGILTTYIQWDDPPSTPPGRIPSRFPSRKRMSVLDAAAGVHNKVPQETALLGVNYFTPFISGRGPPFLAMSRNNCGTSGSPVPNCGTPSTMAIISVPWQLHKKTTYESRIS